ncbi:MAG: insulinase family protein [Oscillospiraceae bacterium]|nr:insulinase family protein [Oscillospiraceae bacterium]
MQIVRRELFPDVYLNYVHAVKFKTGMISAQLVTPLSEQYAAYGALLPAVLRRGTERYGDMRAISTALDLLYGAGLSYTVRKKGENQCLGFVTGFIDDSFALGGEKLLESAAGLLGEVLLRPALHGGTFLSAYVDGEKENLIDAIRSILDDKRDYADMRLIRSMCAGELYGIPRLGTEEQVAAIGKSELYDFYQKLLITAHLELFYCGSAELSRVEDALSEALRELPRTERIPPVMPTRRAAPEEPRSIVERMEVTQGKLSMGWRAATNDAHAMILANLIFGGYSNSKLFLNVRERLSLCYYASSGYHRSKGIVTVSSGVEFNDCERAKDEILAQLESVKLADFEPWELDGARSVLLSAVRSREDSASRMEENTLGKIATGISETDDELIEDLLSVTPERIADAAKSMTLDTVYFLTGEAGETEAQPV